MNLICLVYASNAAIRADDWEVELEALLRAGRAKNVKLGISGSLLFTGSRFAQLIEGQEATVHGLLDVIRLDTRHRDLVVLDHWSIKRRLFENWALAYAGPFGYFDRLIAKPLQAASRGLTPDVRPIVRLMAQLSSTQRS